MAEEAANIFISLNEMIDDWCERRALHPLRLILPAYPLHNMLTDGWAQPYDVLLDVRAFCTDVLTEEELRQINKIVVAIQSMLENR